ncbi:MAG: hypothetical protein Q9204_007652 [Flavoplaca sp. TL-2023a]
MVGSTPSSIIFAALLALSSVHAVPAPSSIQERAVTGINDKGSPLCVFQYVNTMIELQNRVDRVAPDTSFAPGEKIACTSYDQECLGNRFGDSCGGICAFMCEGNDKDWLAGKSTKSDDPERDSVNVKDAKTGELIKTEFGDVIGDLRWHGVQFCGTAPLIRNGTDEEGTKNKNSLGCIKVDYVKNVCPVGYPHPCKGQWL